MQDNHNTTFCWEKMTRIIPNIEDPLSSMWVCIWHSRILFSWEILAQRNLKKSSPWWVPGRGQKSMAVLFFSRENLWAAQNGSLLHYWFHEKKEHTGRVRLVGMVSPTRSCTIVTTTKRNNKNNKNKNNWLLGVLDKAVASPKNGHGTQLVMIYFRFLLPWLLHGWKEICFSRWWFHIQLQPPSNTAIISLLFGDGQWMTLVRSGCSNSLGQICWWSNNLFVYHHCTVHNIDLFMFIKFDNAKRIHC